MGKILAEGNYKSKDDIYFQVFNNEELGFLGKTRDNFSEYNNNNMKSKSKNKLTTKLNKTEDKDTFFLTQGGKKNDKEKQTKNSNQSEIIQTK